MSDELIDIEYYLMLLVWLLGPIVVFALHSRRGRLAGILLYSYIFAFFIAHWPGALVHASPWSGFLDSTDTVAGFQLSTCGLLALLAGAIIVPTPPRPRPIAMPQVAGDATGRFELQYQSARILLLIGISSWILPYTAVSKLPSADAIIGAGKQCSLLAVCLFCWLAWQRGRRMEFRLWLALSCALPVITVVSAGFIGYGIAMLGTILMFVAMFYRPRWIIVVGLVLGIYGGMSFWVAYAVNRAEIRSAVWGGEDLGARTNAISKVFDVIQPFDFSNQDHLNVVDIRLNQNALVGAATRTTPDYVPYVYGKTLYEAAIAVIPRALWPDKPVVAGSGDYVSQHTGIIFAESTSVGMGQVFEFYINFGVTGVVIGFMLLGIMLRRLDIGFVRGIESGDYRQVQFCFLVGAGALQALGSLVEVAASMAGGAVLSIGISRYLDWYIARDARRRTRDLRRHATQAHGGGWGVSG